MEARGMALSRSDVNLGFCNALWRRILRNSDIFRIVWLGKRIMALSDTHELNDILTAFVGAGMQPVCQFLQFLELYRFCVIVQ